MTGIASVRGRSGSASVYGLKRPQIIPVAWESQRIYRVEMDSDTIFSPVLNFAAGHEYYAADYRTTS